MHPTERTIRVDLGSRGYDVVVGCGLLERLGDRVRGLIPTGGRALLAFDEGLPASTVERATGSLAGAGFSAATHPIEASEEEKSIDRLAGVLGIMAGHKLDRRDPVVCLGGGVTGDLVGFASAIYRRGVPVVQCPTTLLAMVDASVGGKTGVNLEVRSPNGPTDLLKNMVGAFHQPLLVLADVDTLTSLPDRFLRCGLAECIKHGLISAEFGDPGLLDWTRAAIPRVLARDAATLCELVARNIAIKAAVVGQDEREEKADGGRALLNLGHTFGHAIETLPGLTPDGDPAHAPLQHGEAVGLGVIAAARCAHAIGRCPASLTDLISDLVRACGLPTVVCGLPPGDEILRLMAQDKKAMAGKLRLILPESPGRCVVVQDPAKSAVLAGIDAIRA